MKEIQEYLNAKTKTEKSLAGYRMLREIGFEAFSRNNYIHIQVREVDISIDFWPTTGKAVIFVKNENQGSSKLEIKDEKLFCKLLPVIGNYDGT